MKLMLTSFGVDSLDTSSQSFHERFFHHTIARIWVPPHSTESGAFVVRDVTESSDHFVNTEAVFYRMPPVSMHSIIGPYFVPDYSTLLLADQVVLDKASFASLQFHSHRSYALVSDALQTLKAEGFVELADFRTILGDNQRLCTEMLENDLEASERWVVPLRESIKIWQQFVKRAHDVVSDGAVDSGEERDSELPVEAPELGGRAHAARNRVESTARSLEQEIEKSDRWRALLTPYLKYVNANIVIARELGVGFHDWLDYGPFYRRKFMAVGEQTLGKQQQQGKAVRDLFEVSFPNFTIRDAGHFVKLVTDRRIEALRSKIQGAVDGTVTFDEQFARTTLEEVLSIERRAAHLRHVSFFVTLPLHLIPLAGPAIHKVAEEAVNKVVEHNLKRPYQWFYLLSDVTERAGRALTSSVAR